MVGDSLPSAIREKKLNDLKKGYYNDHIITLMPGYRPNLEMEDLYFSQKPITKTVKEISHFLYSSYYEKMKLSLVSLDVNK